MSSCGVHSSCPRVHSTWPVVHGSWSGVKVTWSAISPCLSRRRANIAASPDDMVRLRAWLARVSHEKISLAAELSGRSLDMATRTVDLVARSHDRERSFRAVGRPYSVAVLVLSLPGRVCSVVGSPYRLRNIHARARQRTLVRRPVELDEALEESDGPRPLG